MYEVKINGQTFGNIPGCVEDVSINRFLKFRALSLDDALGILHWVLDSKIEFKHTPEVENEIANVFKLIQPVINEIYNFMQTDIKNQIPDTIDVLGHVVKLKKGLLNDLPYWPYVVTKAIIKQEALKEPFDPTDRIPEILAHYLYSEVTKSKYDETKAGEFVEVINDIPMTVAIQLGNFFLRKHQDLFPLNKKNLNKTWMKIIKKPE